MSTSSPSLSSTVARWLRFTAWPRWGQLGRFLVVGVLNTSLDFALFVLLSSWLAWPTALANGMSYSAGVLNGFLFSRSWVFHDAPRQPFGKQFTQFAVVSLSALLLNTALVLFLTSLLSGIVGATPALWFAKVGATGAGLIWNFSLNRAWTFRQPRPNA